MELLRPVVSALATFPDSFTPHPKLARLFAQQTKNFDAGHVDWALGEALAFGTLLQSGTPVRVAGQDTRRGTFSQRHSVLVDFHDEHEYTPLAHIAMPEGETEAPYMIYDSVLSEFAALGFEYGYSVAAADTLVCWEAQFGDFANGAQTIIDQFIVAAQDKWGQKSGLVLLLPHGFEGQGPEHSSARLERFLTLCAEGNLRVTYPSTAAQYFHVLRRQVLAPRRRPLVVLTPKRYLRMAATSSPVSELTDGEFHATLVDDGGADPASITRIVACTGKIGHELIARRAELSAPAAIVRVEQLYPVAEADFVAITERYSAATEIVWVQEEPENMGARIFAMPLLYGLAQGRMKVSWVARKGSASPASGSSKVHDVEQHAILDAAFAPLSEPTTI
jgi:2-oxoglutarate dehydrogenase E1 component